MGFLLLVWADFRLEDTFLGAVKSGEVSVHADVHLQTTSQKHNNGTAAMDLLQF